MELWLIRHGKAEDQAFGTPDSERALIEKGKEQANKMARYLVGPTEGKSVQFWSSPLKRARETTEILMKSFEGVPHIQSEIASGDLESLLVLWEKNNAEIQIVVGHEPFLSDWLEQITGAEQEFSTGSLARIKVTHWIPPEGKLISYIKPKELE